MSVHVTSWVLRHSEERLGRRLVLLALADYANEDGTGAYPSVMTLAHGARLSRAQTQRCLRELEAAGAIKDSGTSRFGTTIYDVVMEGPHIEAGLKSAQEHVGNEARSTLTTTIKKTSLSLPQNGHRTKPTRAQRDEVWDTLTDIFGPALTRSAETLRGKHVASLAEAGATRDEIMRRAKAWPSHFDSATLTAHALEKHWDTLGRKPLRRR